VRPEYVTLAEPNAPEALPVRITQAQDIGMYWLVTGSVGNGADERVVRARVSPQQAIPRVGDTAWFGVVGPHTCFYRGDELIEEATR
jgi:glycerol transport system ATP-binding protein